MLKYNQIAEKVIENAEPKTEQPSQVVARQDKNTKIRA